MLNSRTYQKAKKHNNYELQAEFFLKDIGVKFEVEYLKTDKHFSDDEYPRDIYTVTLRRGTRFMTINYGQSYMSSGMWHKCGDYKRGIANERPKGFSPYREWERNKNFEIPTEYSILTCLTKYDVGSFENFLSDFGYEIFSEADYKNTQKTYKACVKEWDNVQKLFNDKEIEELQEIQ